MKPSIIGIVTATFFGLLPFFTLPLFFSSDINSKFFFVVFSTDVLALYAVYRAHRGTWSPSLKGRPVLWALLLVFIMHSISAALGVFPSRSIWSEIFWSTGLLFFAHFTTLIVLLAEFLKEEDWSLVRRATALSAGLFGFLTLIGVNGFGATGHFLWIPLGRGSMTLGNETYAGAYLLIAFVITLIELVRTERGSIWRNVLMGSAALTACSPLLTPISLLLHPNLFSGVFDHPARILGLARSSSATLFALLAYLCGYWFILRFAAQRFLASAQKVWALVVLLALSVGVGMLFVPGSAVQDAYVEASSAARPIVWGASWEAFKARPVLGWGPENFNHAFEAHFDNRLFQEQNLAEIWFERAHNVFLDTLVSVGVFGAVGLFVLVVAYLRVVYQARRVGRISEIEAVLLYAFVPAHLLQMQTGFDTIASYTLLATVCGYGVFLERSVVPEKKMSSSVGHRFLAVALLVLALFSLKICLFDEYARQAALLRTLTSNTAAEQKSNIEKSLTHTSSFESLRISSASFIQGSLALLVEAPTPGKTKTILEFTDIYERYYKRYLAAQPEHYRARINYAYLLLIKTVLGENRLEDAKAIIRDSYRLSPGNPLTYILDSTAELYGGNLKEADRLMQGALAINPDIEFTQEAAAYLERQKQQFPNISVLKMDNL